MSQPQNVNLIHLNTLLTAITAKIGQQPFAMAILGISQIAWPLAFLYANQNNFHPTQTIFSRGISTIILNFTICRIFGLGLDFKLLHNIHTLNKRNGCVAVHQTIYTTLQFIVPLGIVNTLNITGTLFIFVVDYLIFGTKVNGKQVFGIVVGIIGVIFTINGQYLTTLINPNYEYHTEFKNYITDNPTIKMLACLVFICGNIIWAYGITVQKKLIKVNAITIGFHMGIILTIISSLFMPIFVKQQISFSKFLKGIIFSGLPMALCQICFMSSLNMTKNTGLLTMFVFLNVFTAYFTSTIKYNQSLNFICIGGLVLIIYGLAKAVLSKDSK